MIFEQASHEENYIVGGEYFPIAMFVYDRLEHVIQTIDSLLENKECAFSELYIFSDGPKIGREESVKKVRAYLKEIDGFKRIKIIERDRNFGLAKNIVSGVTEVLTKFDAVIVLEDDILTSKHFLRYMNQALSFYSENYSVGHINGWKYPSSNLDDINIHFTDVMNCWGWATWKSRWALLERNEDKWMKTLSRMEKQDLDLGGTGEFWPQVLLNYSNKKKTWAIFWYLTLYKNKLLSLTPRQSLTANIGHDGSGENCRSYRAYQSEVCNDQVELNFPTNVTINHFAREAVRQHILDRNGFCKALVKKVRSFFY